MFFFGRINQPPEHFGEGEVIYDVGIRKGGEVGNSWYAHLRWPQSICETKSYLLISFSTLCRSPFCGKIQPVSQFFWYFIEQLFKPGWVTHEFLSTGYKVRLSPFPQAQFSRSSAKLYPYLGELFHGFCCKWETFHSNIASVLTTNGASCESCEGWRANYIYSIYICLQQFIYASCVEYIGIINKLYMLVYFMWRRARPLHLPSPGSLISRHALPGSPRFAGKYDDPDFPGDFLLGCQGHDPAWDIDVVLGLKARCSKLTWQRKIMNFSRRYIFKLC